MSMLFLSSCGSERPRLAARGAVRRLLARARHARGAVGDSAWRARRSRRGLAPGVLRAVLCGGAILTLPGAAVLVPVAQAQDGLFGGGGGNLSASNQMRVWVADSSRAASYLNDFDLQYAQGPWFIGVRLELDEEDRYDPERLLEIKRRFAEYRDETINVRAGHFYATFGRGLLLRAQEDETVRLDRDIDGLYGAVRWSALDGQGFIGRPRNDESYMREDLLSGAAFGVRPHRSLRLGGGYVRYDAADPLDADASADDAHLGRPLEELVGANLQWTRGPIDALFEGARRYRRGEIDPRGGWRGTDEEDGEAYYGSVTIGVPGYTVLLEGKDYLRFDPDYSTLPPCNSDGQPVNEGLDERGFGATLTASPQPEVTIEASGAWAGARHSDSERQSANGSVRRDWWGAGAIQIGGEWVEETELESHQYRRWAGPTLEAAYYLTPATSVTLHGKFFDWVNHRRGGEEDEYTEINADLTVSFGMSRAMTLSVIQASDPVEEYDFDDTWISLQATWAFGHNHDLTVKIGEERGGIVCSGGVCHYEPPFTGVRVELLSRF
ncbi:MAG: hypothetical protein GF330_12230 [Candidatus Eisenbacteria bacterium]|nr:hypothetical protein [Candidatus Eisenbacteria bacterium]